MALLVRVAVPGVRHHVIQRGNRRAPLLPRVFADLAGGQPGDGAEEAVLLGGAGALGLDQAEPARRNKRDGARYEG